MDDGREKYVVYLTGQREFVFHLDVNKENMLCLVFQVIVDFFNQDRHLS